MIKAKVKCSSASTDVGVDAAVTQSRAIYNTGDVTEAFRSKTTKPSSKALYDAGVIKIECYQVPVPQQEVDTFIGQYTPNDRFWRISYKTRHGWILVGDRMILPKEVFGFVYGFGVSLLLADGAK